VNRCSCLGLALLLVSSGAFAEAFSYQAYVEFQGRPLDGTRDLRFRVYATATAGTPLASALSFDDWGVQRGLVDVPLDFGPVFNGQPRWLELEIDGTPLSPRQRISATPVALLALSGGTPGSAGAPGATGPAGPAGNAGPAGSVGPVGATGAAGAVGPSGNTGPSGATGPAGAVGATGAAGSESPALLAGLPPAATFGISTSPQPSGVGVRLAEVFEISLPSNGQLQVGALVLRRPLSGDQSWRNWQAQRSNNISVQMRIAIGNGLVQWRLDNGLAQGWELLIADDGLPVEQIRLRFAVGSISRSHDIATVSGPPSAARVRGFSSGQAPGAGYLARWQGVDQPTWRVLDDRARSFPVSINNGAPQPSGADSLTGLWLRVNGTAQSDLFNALQTAGNRSIRLSLTSAAATFVTVDSAQARVSALRLLPSDDGYWVEDYRVDAP